MKQYLKHGPQYFNEFLNGNVLKHWEVMAIAQNQGSSETEELILKILILTSQYIYIFSVVMFVVNNMELFAENSEMNTTVRRNSSNLHLSSSNLSIFQKSILE
jgi:hypothetical protein